MKYRPNFPDRFGRSEAGRGCCGHFFLWYNDAQRHSGLGVHTPASVQYGRAAGLREQRVAVLAVLAGAYAAHPERFVRVIPQPPLLPTAVWINLPALEAPKAQYVARRSC
jgi:putative transposase